MTILTGGELEVLMGLRMSWGRLYSNEITRLQNEDGTKHCADCGADLAHGLALVSWRTLTTRLLRCGSSLNSQSVDREYLSIAE
jgi:hypothetical protein